MKFLSIPLTALVTLVIVAQAEDTVPVPERVDREYQLIKAESIKFFEAETAKCIKQLEKDKMEEGKAGRLESALAVDKMIKDLKEGKLLKDVLNKDRDHLRGKHSIDLVAIGATEVAEGYEIHDNDSVRSKESYSPPVDITYIVKTNSTNVRLGFAADQIIFNWEVERSTLVIVGGPADGQRKQGGGAIPVNEFVTIRQTLTNDEMKIYVNDVERGDFKADFSKVSGPLIIYQAYGSVVTLRDVSVVK